MDYLLIQNDGEIEVNALYLMGASTKDGVNTIGFFGSGNKYALACLLRNKISFRVFSGNTEISIKVREISFGGKTFDQIFIEGQPTSFTTDMGPTWEPWFSIREFVCNAKDAGGYRIRQINELECFTTCSGTTTIYIEMTDEIRDIYENLDRFILEDSQPNDTVKTQFGLVEIYDNPSEIFAIYRKGISIRTPDSCKSLFRYNFANININESRTFAYEFQYKQGIAAALMGSVVPEVVEKYLKSYHGKEEESIYWQYTDGIFSEPWKKALFGKTIYSTSMAKLLPYEDWLSGVVLPDNLVTLLENHCDWAVIHGHRKTAWDIVEPTEMQSISLKSAIEECARFGFCTGYKTEVAKFDIPTVMAMTVDKEKTIIVAEKYMEDYDELVATMLEEIFHSQGLHDGSREFEQFLVRHIVKISRMLVAKKQAARRKKA